MACIESIPDIYVTISHICTDVFIVTTSNSHTHMWLWRSDTGLLFVAYHIYENHIQHFTRIELSYAHVIVTFRYRWCRPHQLAVAQLLRLRRYVSLSEKSYMWTLKFEIFKEILLKYFAVAQLPCLRRYTLACFNLQQHLKYFNYIILHLTRKKCF